MTLDLVFDNHLLVLRPCRCRGKGWCDDEDCIAGEVVVEHVDLSTLLRNIAVAGALERARKLWATDWYPNTSGRSAP